MTSCFIIVKDSGNHFLSYIFLSDDNNLGFYVLVMQDHRFCFNCVSYNLISMR